MISHNPFTHVVITLLHNLPWMSISMVFSDCRKCQLMQLSLVEELCDTVYRYMADGHDCRIFPSFVFFLFFVLFEENEQKNLYLNLSHSKKVCVFFVGNDIVIQNLHGVCRNIWDPLVRELLDNSYTVNSHSEEQVSHLFLIKL